MNPLTLEWLDKAGADLATARRELRARIEPNYDAVCFHAQQSAEKALKAVLQESNVNIPKTHQLMDLLGLCVKFEAAYLMLQADLMSLEGYAVMFRYPGQSANKAEAKAAYKAAEIISAFIKTRLTVS
jgi:HEPN domain-containing protein